MCSLDKHFPILLYYYDSLCFNNIAFFAFFMRASCIDTENNQTLFLYACGETGHNMLNIKCPSVKLTSHFDMVVYTSNTLDAIDLGPSTKKNMPIIAVQRLILYPIACELVSLKIAYLIDFHLILGLL